MTSVVVAATLRFPGTAAAEPGPRTKALKRLQAARTARLKRAGQSIVHTLKQADTQAREMFVKDLQDITEAATEVLLLRVVDDEPAGTEK